MTLVAMTGAAIFVISCMPIPVPFAGTCSHPCGTGLGALLIGPAATVVVASIALLFQALFLAHGGLTTLGANVVSMGVVGAFSAYGLFQLLRKARVPVFPAALAAGVISDWATYADDVRGIVLGTARRQILRADVRLDLALVRPHATSLGHCRRGGYCVGLPVCHGRRPELLARRATSCDLGPEVPCDSRLQPELVELAAGSDQAEGGSA